MTPLDRISQLTDENAELRSEIERLENFTALGIHTCHADCRRPMCVLRRERDKALAALARATAERDRWAHDYLEKYDETRDLRARVAELERQLKSEIDARNGWWDNCKQAEQRNAELEEKAERYRLTTLRQDARNAELVAAGNALRWAYVASIGTEKSGCVDRWDTAALASAESATPALHPDTERLDWLEQNTVTLYCSGLYDMSSDAAVGVPGLGTFTGETLRAAIDAARKQGGAA